MATYRILLFIIFCLCFHTLSAQPPGYLGKRFSISLNTSSSIALKGPDYNNKGNSAYNAEPNGIGFNIAYELNLSYVLQRYASIGLSVSQYNTGATARLLTPALGTELLVIPPSNIGKDVHDVFMQLKVKSIGLTHQMYKSKKGGLAPFGNQFFYGLKVSSVKGNIRDKHTTYVYDDLSAIFGHGPLGTDDAEVLGFTFLMGWANTQIFFDRVLLKTGLTFGIPISIKRIKYANDPSSHPDYSSNENLVIYENEMYKRMQNHELFNVDIGIGYLLF